MAVHREGVSLEEEQLTWRDYDPEGGMPLPNGELSQPEINAIFNSENVDVDLGNYILNVMHWRRQSGALIDVGLEFPAGMGVDRDMALKGLNFVRQVVPDVDENAAGQTWAEEEIQRRQEELQTRAVQLGFYKADNTEQELEQEEEQQQGTDYGREKTGQSVLRQTREYNEAQWELEKANLEVQKQKAATNALHAARGPLELAGRVQPQVSVNARVTKTVKGPFGIKIRAPEPNAYLETKRQPEWVKYYQEQAQVIKENAVPQLSTTARLAPPFLVLLLVLFGCYYLSENYTPPPTSARIWPGTPPSVATLTTITGLLTASFIMGRIPPLWRFYSKYMTIVPAYPFAISIIGALFRHDRFGHLAANVFQLWAFGLFLHEQIGRGNFVALYLASGAFGAYSALAYNVMRKNWTAYILGSSGCMVGLIAGTCTINPNARLKAFGYEIPIAPWVFLAVFGLAEGSAIAFAAKTTIDHAGHIGGLLVGAAAGMRMRQKAKAGLMTEADKSVARTPLSVE